MVWCWPRIQICSRKNLRFRRWGRRSRLGWWSQQMLVRECKHCLWWFPSRRLLLFWKHWWKERLRKTTCWVKVWWFSRLGCQRRGSEGARLNVPWSGTRLIRLRRLARLQAGKAQWILICFVIFRIRFGWLPFQSLTRKAEQGHSLWFDRRKLYARWDLLRRIDSWVHPTRIVSIYFLTGCSNLPSAESILNSLLSDLTFFVEEIKRQLYR